MSDEVDRIALAIVAAARSVGMQAYFNIARQQKVAARYAVFAFRSHSGLTAFDGVPRRGSEVVEIHVYDKSARAAVQGLTELYFALGKQVVTRGGLETGATDSDYHYASMRLGIRPQLPNDGEET